MTRAATREQIEGAAKDLCTGLSRPTMQSLLGPHDPLAVAWAMLDSSISFLRMLEGVPAQDIREFFEDVLSDFDNPIPSVSAVDELGRDYAITKGAR